MYDVSDLVRLPNWPLIVKVAGILGKSQAPYLVGGWVRDALLERDSHDIDFAVTGDGIKIAAQVARVFGGAAVPLDDQNGVGRVVLSGGSQTFDFATYGGRIDADLSRLDFTVDALAVDLGDADSGTSPRLIDLHDGVGDLKRRLITATNDSVFTADPARLLRAVRLAAGLQFDIEPRTESRIKTDSSLISSIAGERVREELVSCLNLPGSGRFLAYMDRLGLLTAIIPELELSRGVTQPKEHHWDVLTHCLMTVEAFDFLLGQAEWPYAAVAAKTLLSPEVADYFDAPVGAASGRAALFRLASLLHDISKPETRTVESTGRIRFLGHGEEGAEVAVGILRRLRFSNRETRLVELAVKHHLRPTQMGWPDLPSRRAIYRYYRDTEEAALGVLYLSLADHMAARGPQMDPEDWRLHADITMHILSQREEQPARLPSLIDGYDIMKSFGLSPGPSVGELLENVREARAAGEISSREQALQLVAKLLGAQISRDQKSGEKQD